MIGPYNQEKLREDSSYNFVSSFAVYLLTFKACITILYYNFNSGFLVKVTVSDCKEILSVSVTLKLLFPGSGPLGLAATCGSLFAGLCPVITPSH